MMRGEKLFVKSLWEDRLGSRRRNAGRNAGAARTSACATVARCVVVGLAIPSFAAGASWTFATGAPELSKAATFAMAQMQPMAAAAAAPPRMIQDPGTDVGVQRARTLIPTIPPDIRKPPGVSAPAAYGLIKAGANGAWLLDGDDVQGWVLYLDWKGDGDFSAADPHKLERVNGLWQLRLEVEEGDVRWPCLFQLTRNKMVGQELLGLAITSTTVRTGMVELDGRQYPFRLTGSRGRYDCAGCSLAIDRFGEGGFDKYLTPKRVPQSGRAQLRVFHRSGGRVAHSDGTGGSAAGPGRTGEPFAGARIFCP